MVLYDYFIFFFVLLYFKSFIIYISKSYYFGSIPLQSLGYITKLTHHFLNIHMTYLYNDSLDINVLYVILKMPKIVLIEKYKSILKIIHKTLISSEAVSSHVNRLCEHLEDDTSNEKKSK